MINSQKRFQSGKIAEYNCSFTGLNQQRTSTEAFIKNLVIFTPDMWQWKTLKLSTNVDKKSLETVFSCHFETPLSIAKSIFDCDIAALLVFVPHSTFIIHKSYLLFKND